MLGDVRFRSMGGRLNRNLAGGEILGNKPHVARCSTNQQIQHTSFSTVTVFWPACQQHVDCLPGFSRGLYLIDLFH